MKKIIVIILVSGIVFGAVGILAGNYLYHANEVSYTPSNSEFNVDNVESAIDELYGKINNGIIKSYFAGASSAISSPYLAKYFYINEDKTYGFNLQTTTNPPVATDSDICDFGSDIAGLPACKIKKAGYYIGAAGATYAYGSFALGPEPKYLNVGDLIQLYSTGGQYLSQINSFTLIAYLGSTNYFNN